jgi:hypothetical protein
MCGILRKVEQSTYHIVRKLAVGGMAEIYLARQRSVAGFERQLVVKRILPEYASDPSFVASFLNEAKLAAQLSHQNIVQIFDLGRAEGTYFLAMEYIQGTSLALVCEWLQRDPTTMPLDVALLILDDICAGLDHAHHAKDADGVALGIVHRDVTPSNVIIAESGLAKIVDFGIAKATAKNEKMTQTGTLKGKMGYFAPEQVLGEPIDKRIDVFAAGIVLYELLGKRNPFRGSTEFATLQNIVHEAPPPLGRADVPGDLDTVIARALAKNPDERFTSCAELADALRRFRGGGEHADVARFVALRAEPSPEVAPLPDDTGMVEMVVSGLHTRAPRRSMWMPAVAVLGAVSALGAWMLKPSTPTAPLLAVTAPASEPAHSSDAQPAAPAIEAPKAKQLLRPLARAPGHLRFAVEPWAIVYINGKRIGETPLAPRDLAPGTYDVKLENADLGKSIVRKIRIEPDKDALIQHRF